MTVSRLRYVLPVGIGRNKKHVKPVEPHLRPKGMGLGADKSAILQDRGVNAHKRRKPGDKREEEELQLKRGLSTLSTTLRFCGRIGLADEDIGANNYFFFYHSLFHSKTSCFFIVFV